MKRIDLFSRCQRAAYLHEVLAGDPAAGRGTGARSAAGRAVSPAPGDGERRPAGAGGRALGDDDHAKSLVFPGFFINTLIRTECAGDARFPILSIKHNS